MSIAPPSDLVLDVAQAADPERVRAATAKLVQLGAGTATGGDDFAAQLASASTRLGKPAPLAAPLPASTAGVVTRRESPYQKFEAMMLQNFIQTILPKDSDLFGDAASADAYRSMLADQLASQLAKTGKLGIAHAIEAAEAGAGPAAPGPSASAQRARASSAPAALEAVSALTHA